MTESQTTPTPDQASIDDLTPEEANRIIHSHRKVRYGTACWPCRQRKVKCDNKQPCENCVKREHPQLCSYKPNRTASHGTNHKAAGSVTTEGGNSNAGGNGATSTTAPTTAGNGTASSVLNRKRPHSPEDPAADIAAGQPPLKQEPGSATWPRAAIGKSSLSSSLPQDQHIHSGLRPFASAASSSSFMGNNNGLYTDKLPRGPVAAGVVDETEAPEAVTRYLGQNSIPSLLREQSGANDLQEGVDIRQDMRSILGLDTSAPFPLMSSKHLDSLTREISAELPSDREVMKLFRTYKETPQQFWGFVVDIDDLESKLMVYLEDRARNASNAARTPKPVSASWLAILFALLAVGSQYHDSPYHIRTRDSQKYIQISFHFLRLGNFLLRPTFDSIQALLLTSFVLLNDMKAEASWALLGLTCRLAQSLGLHRPNPSDGRDSARNDGQSKEMIRRKLWWTCVWHDTLTSLSFDRPPMTNIPCCPIPTVATTIAGEYGYLDTMYHLCEIISRRLNPDVATTVSYEQMVENCEAVENLRNNVAPNIRIKEQCKRAIDRLQHYAVRLHTSFVISVCCRPALRRDCTKLTPEQKRHLSDKCQHNLAETVRMFLAMHQLSVIPTRSWAFTYHGLSSALLLGILGETKNSPEVRQLQGDLIAALSATAAKEATSPTAHIPKTDKDIELSGPLWRALTALRNIYEHGTIMGTSQMKGTDSSGTGSGARTPLPPMLMGPMGNNVNGNNDGKPFGMDPHQDAALAMAEMQNGTAMTEYTPKYVISESPFSGPLFSRMLLTSHSMGYPPVSMDNIANLDPSTYMSPMDLYESIWWESPDPWNSGVDTMNFDFVAQPPPGQPQQQFYF
ncbi:fungal specific transcription factor domain-containing protein [Colletotrichum scovillei]|uniref:fungal specific transcription factor domain-containing protein n=1 Tax=Colletotrichum scovillei TaxID=1209932 RepID=UPI0015C3A9F3|nr:fungal specific transcription factor domain-containing protein [Colletotrichum scovillei]KAF4782599.1 fungal specific transcription factor domain-containing protein [Colletotrichum scovillei]